MEDYVRKRSLRLVAFLAVIAGALFLVYSLASVFAPLILGFLIAYMLDPLADALERRKFSRLGAVVVIFSAASVIVVGMTTILAFYTARGVAQFAEDSAGEVWLSQKDSRVVATPRPGIDFEDLNHNGVYDPGYWIRIRDQLSAWKAALPSYMRDGIDDFVRERRELASDENRRARVKQSLDDLWTYGERRLIEFATLFDPDTDAPPTTENAATTEGVGGLEALFGYFLLCPLYVFFFLLEINAIVSTVRRYLPHAQRDRIERLFGEIDHTLSAFFRGRLIVCIIKGLMTALLLFLLDVPFWLPLGMSAGFLSLLPYVGICLSLVPALLLSWFDQQSLAILAGIGITYAALEFVEGFVLIPRFLGKETGLHPLTIIVTLVIFGKVFGFVGLLLSVPLAAITKILAAEFILPLIEEFAGLRDAEGSDPGGAAPAGGAVSGA